MSVGPFTCSVVHDDKPNMQSPTHLSGETSTKGESEA